MQDEPWDPPEVALEPGAPNPDVPGGPGDASEQRPFQGGVRCLAAALGVGAITIFLMVFAIRCSGSLGESLAWRQASLALSFALPALGWVLWDGRKNPHTRAWWGHTLPRSKALGWAAGVALAGVAILLVVSSLLARSADYQELLRHQMAFARWRTGPELARTWLLLALIPALCEEWFFRGYLLGGLTETWGARVGVLVQACIFAVFHGGAWPVALLMGGLFGVLARGTRSIWPGMTLHALNNGIVVLVAGGGMFQR